MNKKSDRNYVWLVEMKMDNGLYVPCVAARLSRREAINEKHDCENANPDSKFRVQRYESVKLKGE